MCFLVQDMTEGFNHSKVVESLSCFHFFERPSAAARPDNQRVIVERNFENSRTYGNILALLPIFGKSRTVKSLLLVVNDIGDIPQTRHLRDQAATDLWMGLPSEFLGGRKPLTSTSGYLFQSFCW